MAEMKLCQDGAEKKTYAEKTFQYFYHKKNTGTKKIFFENFKFMFVGHLIYMTGVVCGFIGLIINILKRIKAGRTDV